jgi:hypothetical protein
MANLNFKWGSHSNLSKLTTSEVGTLYFTKDEGGLYLGVEANKKPQRIQGIVQYYANLNAFKADVLPPYSADVIYYIASENALVKWSGDKVAADGTVKSGEFVVLNVTAAEFTSTVTTLNQDIATNAGNISSLSGKLGETTAAAGTITAFGRIKTLEEAVDALEAFTGIGGTTGSSLTDRVAALETWQGTMNTWKESISSTVADNT